MKYILELKNPFSDKMLGTSIKPYTETELVDLKVIGEGSFGYVVGDLNKKVALKSETMNLIGCTHNTAESSQINTIKLKFANFINSIVMYQYLFGCRRIYCQLEIIQEDNYKLMSYQPLISGTILYDLKPDQNELNIIMKNAFKQLLYMHEELKLAHLDLGPKNILFDSNTKKITFIDFGLSKFLLNDAKHFITEYFRKKDKGVALVSHIDKDITISEKKIFKLMEKNEINAFKLYDICSLLSCFKNTRVFKKFRSQLNIGTDPKTFIEGIIADINIQDDPVYEKYPLYMKFNKIQLKEWLGNLTFTISRRIKSDEQFTVFFQDQIKKDQYCNIIKDVVKEWERIKHIKTFIEELIKEKNKNNISLTSVINEYKQKHQESRVSLIKNSLDTNEQNVKSKWEDTLFDKENFDNLLTLLHEWLQDQNKNNEKYNQLFCLTNLYDNIYDKKIQKDLVCSIIYIAFHNRSRFFRSITKSAKKIIEIYKSNENIKNYLNKLLELNENFGTNNVLIAEAFKNKVAQHLNPAILSDYKKSNLTRVVKDYSRHQHSETCSCIKHLTENEAINKKIKNCASLIENMNNIDKYIEIKETAIKTNKKEYSESIDQQLTFSKEYLNNILKGYNYYLTKYEALDLPHTIKIKIEDIHKCYSEHILDSAKIVELNKVIDIVDNKINKLNFISNNYEINEQTQKNIVPQINFLLDCLRSCISFIYLQKK